MLGASILRHSLTAVAVLALLASSGVAWAESYNTPNLPSAEPYQQEGGVGGGELRLFNGDGNQTFAAGVRVRAGEETEAEFTIFTMDTSGEDPIADVVRDSTATLVGLSFKWLAYQEASNSGQTTVSVMPGFEIPIGNLEGTNTEIPATALSDDVIPTISVPVEWMNARGTRLKLVPRYIGFDDSPSVGDETIDGFGDVFAVGFGVSHPLGEYSAMGDVQLVLTGENSIDDATNDPTSDFVWSVGGSWQPEDDDVRVDAFLTNAAGPTAATSIIATPDQSIGLGLRVSGEF